MTEKILQAKEVLDKLISKQRVHMYKPIQVAEILFHTRLGELTIDQLKNDLEDYRNPSKRWRDNTSRLLIAQISTSSQKYQDNLFESNAIPPDILAVLAHANENGIVERYIYQRFYEKQQHILRLSKALLDATTQSFKLDEFLEMFSIHKGIKRSVDKAFEIIVYALFNTLVKHMKAIVTISAAPDETDLLHQFAEFAHLLLGITPQTPTVSFPARLYRAGVTNAADRGLDMWANFGPAIQIKHLTLTEDLAEDISQTVSADQIVIVCKDGEKPTLERITQQLGQRVQGIIVQSQLATWYEEALQGRFAARLGGDLLHSLRQEFRNEFPYSETFEPFYQQRQYHLIHQPNSPFWLPDKI